jgi:signal transduction histidine kinase
MTRPLSTRILVKVLLAHAVLLPVLAICLGLIVERSHIELFVDFVHDTLARRTSELQTGRADTHDAGLLQFLDTAVLDGRIVYAEVLLDGRVLRSQLTTPSLAWPARADDFEYGEGRDNAYFVSAPFKIAGQTAVLRLGFDETPTGEGIRRAWRSILATLGVYLAVVIGLALIVSRQLTRPLEELRRISHRIASGDFSHNIKSDSEISEVRDLGADLEAMRGKLVGANERLQRELEERAALESRLLQKQRLETVGTLASGMAHEINNVLVPITLYTETALARLPENHSAYPGMIRVLALSERASNIIAKVLAFGRRANLDPAGPIMIAPAVEEGVRTFDALRPPNVELQTRVDTDCGMVIAESTAVVQVVMNLCTNACQALPPAGGSIEVKLHTTDIDAAEDSDGVPPGRYVELEVSDSGCGMDETTQAHIFDPFFTTREVGKGTGLGLSVVHGIVSSLGGQVRVRSTPGRGSSFRVLLPQPKSLATKEITTETEQT